MFSRSTHLMAVMWAVDTVTIMRFSPLGQVTALDTVVPPPNGIKHLHRSEPKTTGLLCAISGPGTVTKH